ncbi:MAG: hypothetical protein ABIV39_16365, partial [Verrucomicrobiota bacterium]
MMWPKLKNQTRCAVLVFSLMAVISLSSGCATATSQSSRSSRQFDFARDTFSFSNELSWVYFFDANGKWKSHRREPQPEYKQHCFVVVHAAKQFFKFAEFDPTSPAVDEKTYRDLIHQIVFGSDMRPADVKIKVPGYANLNEFSRAHEDLLKRECGSAWRSYFQRGHWRIMLPFSRRHQAGASEEFVRELTENQALVVHLVRFPQLSINHAVMLVGFRETTEAIVF